MLRAESLSLIVHTLIYLQISPDLQQLLSEKNLTGLLLVFQWSVTEAQQVWHNLSDIRCDSILEA